jgi:hypothetical protein
MSVNIAMKYMNMIRLNLIYHLRQKSRRLDKKMAEDIPQYYQCYHCNNFSTNIEDQYLRHGAREHLYKPLFPNATELVKYNLVPQGKNWEKPLRTEAEAREHLARWAEKRIREDEQREQLKIKRAMK